MTQNVTQSALLPIELMPKSLKGKVGAPRFELGTSCSQSRRADQTTLRPGLSIVF